jgi:hypothetical protein
MGSPTPPDFAGLISSVARELARRELPFMIIGGHAVLLHGRPRLTEDLILHKLFAGRPRDLEDVSGIVLRQRGKLDWDYVKQWAGEFKTVPGREELPDQVAELRRLPINGNT